MQRKFFIKAFVFVLAGLFIFGLAIPGYAMMCGNTSEEGFIDPGGTTGVSSTKSTTTIKYLIIKSAKYFLTGKSSVDLLASRLEAAELDGINYYELQQIVNDALWNMRTARYYYRELKNLADATPYNQTVIAQLAAFDYNTFANEYGLNGHIYDQVTAYLQPGDIRGSYDQLLTFTDNIINFLERVQWDVYFCKFPAMATIWKLNQECAHMLLFGQYIAQTFYRLSRS
jgi:hypothetical protein